MRGRTLSHAVVILDEAQNTTAMQMKMFLTRLGENSRMIVTGDPISAERAYHFGMVNDLCEPGQALDHAKALAERIIVNAPLAVRKSRELSLKLVDSDDETGFRLSGESMIELAQTEDFWEGPKAFIEKRDPVWQGK